MAVVRVCDICNKRIENYAFYKVDDQKDEKAPEIDICYECMNRMMNPVDPVIEAVENALFGKEN